MNTTQPIRNPQLKQRFVTELLIPGISPYLLKKYTGYDGNGSRPTYPPSEIRKAKLAMNSIEDVLVLHQRPAIINVRMAKGGTGKTCVCANLSAAYASMGYRVLCIDGDPQGSLTRLFGVDTSTADIRHIGHLIEAQATRKPVNLDSAVIHVYPDRMLDLIGADIRLTQTDSWLMANSMHSPHSIDKLISAHPSFFNKYEIIVIDSAPGTTLLALNLMVACKTLLPVVWLDNESLMAMNLLISNIDEINAAIEGKNLGVEIVANGYHPSYKHCKEAVAILAENYRDFLNPNILPHYAGFAKQQSLGGGSDSKGPLVETDGNSVGSRAIYDLAKSLLGRYGIKLAGQLDESVPVRRGATLAA